MGSYIATASHVGLAPPVQQALMRPWLGEQGQAAFYRQIAQADERYTREVEDRYGERDCPVLIAWGSEDTWLPAERAQELSARIPHARLH